MKSATVAGLLDRARSARRPLVHEKDDDVDDATAPTPLVPPVETSNARKPAAAKKQKRSR